jgi:hypothetical protein
MRYRTAEHVCHIYIIRGSHGGAILQCFKVSYMITNRSISLSCRVRVYVGINLSVSCCVKIGQGFFVFYIDVYNINPVKLDNSLYISPT